ncbi:DNA ligase D [Actinokineospora sp. NBRC 105648]|uniref:DNA ligase D n=1 Tax=Actinokineospora sp. NBRC 105648 TaxID=3032206 RepID=UPI0024A3D0ED|nr:DNA ligase D [Actinokineospora sp. NBRC 105648]GLZ37914.1 DNA ligase D [Actinokineospora sp. NBRC 105648]
MAADISVGVPEWVEPMLAKPDGGRLPQGHKWTYEHKLDGYRCAMRVAADGSTVLTSRNGIDFTDEFPTLAGVLAPALAGQAAVFDGEIVVYDEHGRPDFGALQERRGRYRKHSSSPRRTERFDDVPVRFLAFDLLRLGDQVLLHAPYDQRRALLEHLVMPDPHLVSVVPAVTFDALTADRLTPATLLERVAAAGHEGLIAKLRASTYVPGQRSEAWLKHPLIQTQEVIVCGLRPGQSRFTGILGGLLLGAHHPDTGHLVYLGDVGTGFTERERSALQDRLQALERPRHPFAVDPPREDVRRARWVDPVLVGEVVYRQFTRGAGRLRHTAWRGLREDRDPADVIAPHVRTGSPPAAESEPEPVTNAGTGERITVQAGKRRLTLSNLDKVLYPADGFTKGEVIHYYSRIAPVLLPHLAGRPVTTIRFPDGVHGEQFSEKNVPRGAPPWLPTARLARSGARSGLGPGTIEYPLLDELAALVWAANLAALELHVPQWTIGPGPTRRHPDRLVFDLDPGPGTTIVECCRVAERLRDVLVADGLTPVATTSGSKGMQVYAGILTRQPERPSTYAKALAERFAAQTPDLVTATMAKNHRHGKVFIDWSQNNPAKTTIAPYSLRGREHPTVSTPITWDEVDACRRPGQLVFTADDVLDRVGRSGDLFSVLSTKRAALPAR